MYICLDLARSDPDDLLTQNETRRTGIRQPSPWHFSCNPVQCGVVFAVDCSTRPFAFRRSSDREAQACSVVFIPTRRVGASGFTLVVLVGPAGVLIMCCENVEWRSMPSDVVLIIRVQQQLRETSTFL